MNALASLTHVTSLDLGSTRSEDSSLALVCEMLRKNTHLRSLEYWSNPMRDAGVASLCETLNVCGLEKLDLGGNRLHAEQAKRLAAVLKENRCLLKLSLNNNDIADEGAVSIAEALRRNRTLTEITITNNDIVAYGASALVDAVDHNYTLLSVDFSRNKGLSSDDTQRLAEFCRRNKSVQWKDAHKVVMDVAIAMAPLRLPNYVLLEIVDWYLKLCESNVKRI